MTSVQVNKVMTLTGHRDSVYALESIPDSPIFFSGAGDGMIVKWTLGSDEGERIAQMDASVYALRYHAESGYLLAGHNFDGLHVLDWKSKKEVGSLKFTQAVIFDLAVVGETVLAATGDGAISVINLSTLTVLHTLNGAGASARCIALRPGKEEIAVGYSDNHIRVYALRDFSVVHQWVAHENSIFCLRYTPDGRKLLSGSRDARLKTWNAQEDYKKEQEVVAHLFAINDLCFSPDWKHFVTCSMDKSVKVWRTDDLTLLKVIDKGRHAGHGTSVNKLLWMSHGNQVVSASDDRTISIWDVIF